MARHKRNVSTTLVSDSVCCFFSLVNSYRPNISMHILHTVLHTYPKAIARRIFLMIRSFLSLRFFSLFKGDTVGRNKFDFGTGVGEGGEEEE